MAAKGDSRLAVGYIRVSTDDQQNGTEAQRAAIEAWAQLSGVAVLSWHEDRLSGGALVEDRPGLLDALSSLRDHNAGLLVAAKRDRLARDVVVAATIERLVRDSGAVVLTSDGVTSDDTPEGALIRTLLDAFAAYERAMIRARTRAALGAKRKRGERVGKVPLGFRAEGRMLIPDHAEQTVIDSVRALRASHLGLRAIARKMESDGIRLRHGSWHPMRVRRMLEAV